MLQRPGGRRQTAGGTAARRHGGTASMLVVLTGLTQARNDKEQVMPMLEQLAQLPSSLGLVDSLTADCGFFREKNIIAC